VARDRALGDAVKRLLAVLVAVALGASSGCATVRPWEREDLAKPAMRVGGDPDESAQLDHTFAARESAMGAGSSAGGGCACN